MNKYITNACKVTRFYRALEASVRCPVNESDYKALLRKSKMPFPMKGIERKIYLAIFLTLVSGVVLSQAMSNWGWFSGSGSLIVVIGIYLAWRDFVGTVGDVRKLYSQTIQDHLRLLDESPTYDSTRPGGIISQAMENGEKRRELEFQWDRAVALCDALRVRLRTTEAIILGLGTFISGFGTLLPSFVLGVS